MGLWQQKQLTQEIVLDHGLNVAGACKLTGMCRSQYYYVSNKDDSAVMVALDDLSFKNPVYGFRKLHSYLRREGKPWNHKKIYRVYKLLNMNNKRRVKHRLPVREKQHLEQILIKLNEHYQQDYNLEWLLKRFDYLIKNRDKFTDSYKAIKKSENINLPTILEKYFA
ncbi:IS3 family transposase [Sphingobacterium faecium]|uniref:IS3 family transposase n=1 Tax=Sphingobacterium faecium TaxID=34087 RepID=UPI0032095892